MARARRWFALIAGGFGLLVVLAVLLRVAGVTLPPPALLDTDDVDEQTALREYPPRTERIEVARPDGAVLRGMFAPAHEGAPVVLLLQEASASAAALHLGWGKLAWQLRDLGFATLVLDYGGVGLSAGERDVRNLRADALAMWGEALARAGGDPQRVVVRGTSLGTIATALLLQAGVQPGGVIAIAPVRADTAAERFARFFYGELAARFAWFCYGPIAPVDVPAELARATLPEMVITPQEDVFLDEADLHAFDLGAGRRAAGHTRRAGDHLLVSFLAHRLFEEELPLLLELAGDGPPVDARLAEVLGRLPPEIADAFGEDAPEHARLRALLRYHAGEVPLRAAAAALAEQPPLSSARLLWLLRESGPGDMDFEPLAHLLSLWDPAGLLPIDRIEAASRPNDRGPMHLMASWQTLLSFSSGIPHWRSSSSVTLGDRVELTLSSDGTETWAMLLGRGLAPDDAARQSARVLLKSQRYADRLRPDSGGVLGLEVWDAGDWKTLDPRSLDGDTRLNGSIRITGHR